jgi:hypothetical protein
VIFHGVMARACRVHRLPVNPVAKVEKPRLTAPGAIDVFGPEEIHALVRAAASEQDAAIFLAAAFISPLDLVGIGLLSSEDAQALHGAETRRQPP